jgi:hypothetical protein
MVFERAFLVGHTTSLKEGVVSADQFERWRDYLQREGHPLLRCPDSAESVLYAWRNPNSPGYQLHLHLSDITNGVFPGEPTWAEYFRDVEGFTADTAEELAAEMDAAGWEEHHIDRYRDVDLEAEVPEDTPEWQKYQEYVDEELDSPEMFTSPVDIAFGYLRDLTAGFGQDPASRETVGKLRFEDGEEEDDRRRYVTAADELTLTALQELFNDTQCGIRIELHLGDLPPGLAPER